MGRGLSRAGNGAAEPPLPRSLRAATGGCAGRRDRCFHSVQREGNLGLGDAHVSLRPIHHRADSTRRGHGCESRGRPRCSALPHDAAARAAMGGSGLAGNSRLQGRNSTKRNARVLAGARAGGLIRPERAPGIVCTAGARRKKCTDRDRGPAHVPHGRTGRFAGNGPRRNAGTPAMGDEHRLAGTHANVAETHGQAIGPGRR